MFRAQAALGTAFGLEAKRFMDAGELVPDEIVVGVVENGLTFRAVGVIGAVSTAEFEYLVPMFSALAGLLLLGSAITAPQAIAGAIVLGGLLVSGRARAGRTRATDVRPGQPCCIPGSDAESGQATMSGEELGGDVAEPLDCLGPERVVDVRGVALRGDPTGLSKDLQVVAHRRLGDLTAGDEVAGADLLSARELPQDRQARRVRRALEQQRVGVGELPHGGSTILTTFDIVKYG
jgi:hypothetical protein